MVEPIMFPPSDAIESDELPEGYPYVCPKCSSIIPDVFWSREQGEFLNGENLVLTLCEGACVLVLLLKESDHCRVSLFSVLHQC
jgi:hypothetical protein